MTETISWSSPLVEASVEPVVGARRAPAGTTALFLLLVATVLAASTSIFATVWVSAIGGERLLAVAQACEAKEPILHQEITSPDERQRWNDAEFRATQCIGPVYLDETSFAVVTGTGVLLSLTGFLYWSYPRWIIYRRRLCPLEEEDCPELAEYLAELSRQAGLARQPIFLLAPYASTTGGLTFGRLGRRYVGLDVGLVTWFTTDRAAFRAVVLHELAHLRNRDLDTTYLTKSIWWSFITVAFIPTVVVLVLPTLFSWYVPPKPVQLSDFISVQPIRRLHTGLALLLLTGLVYLTRNAILRLREIYADARAAACDGTDSALRAVVGALAAPAVPRWRAWVSTHPSPRRRIEAIDAPKVALRTGSWGLFVAGMATAMIAINLRYALSLATAIPFRLNVVITGLAGVPGLAVPLIVAVWRAVASTPGHRTPLRTVALLPTVLSGGFLLGDLASWISSVNGKPPLLVSIATGEFSAVVALLLLLAGGVLLTVGLSRWLARC